MSATATARPAAPSAVTGILFGLFAICQVVDFLTTNYALGHLGLGEINFVMAWCFGSLGVFGLAFLKVVCLGFTALAAASIPRWSLTLMVLLSATAAASNVLHVASSLAA